MINIQPLFFFFLIPLFDSHHFNENLSMDKLEVCSYFLIHSIYYRYRRYNGDQRFKIKKRRKLEQVLQLNTATLWLLRIGRVKKPTFVIHSNNYNTLCFSVQTDDQ